MHLNIQTSQVKAVRTPPRLEGTEGGGGEGGGGGAGGGRGEGWEGEGWANIINILTLNILRPFISYANLVAKVINSNIYIKTELPVLQKGSLLTGVHCASQTIPVVCTAYYVRLYQWCAPLTFSTSGLRFWIRQSPKLFLTYSDPKTGLHRNRHKKENYKDNGTFI